MPIKENAEDHHAEMKIYLRKWRHLRGYKQVEFAKMLGISPATLSRYENNKGDLGIIRINEIAKVLKLNYTQLLQDPGNLNLAPAKKIRNRRKQ